MANRTFLVRLIGSLRLLQRDDSFERCDSVLLISVVLSLFRVLMTLLSWNDVLREKARRRLEPGSLGDHIGVSYETCLFTTSLNETGLHRVLGMFGTRVLVVSSGLAKAGNVSVSPCRFFWPARVAVH